MTKANITQYDNTAANNTDVQDVPLGENAMYPSNVNNAFREIMADLADINDGTVAMTSPSATSLSVTNNITVGGTVDGRDVATDGTKLDGIEAGATNVSALTDLSITDGTDGQVLTTNGAGTFTFEDAAGGSSDADTLDGLDSTAFLRSNADDTATGDISFQGMVTVTATGYPILRLRPSGSSNSARIQFGLSGDEDHGQITYTNSSSTMTFRANNTDIMNVTGTSVSLNKQLDLNNNDIYGVDQIFHEGDTNTYIQFHASDQFRVVTGGVERLEVNNSGVNVAGNPVATTQFNTVGSYCLAHHTSSNASLSANGNVGGSVLRAVGFYHLLSISSSSAYYPEEDGSALSGSWRVMGEARDNSAPTALRPATLFVRYA